MELETAGDAGDDAVLDGGPLDGQVRRIASGAAELLVVMTDGQRHRYQRTESMQRLPDGRAALVFTWAGRSLTAT